ncbi:TIM barrel protein [Dactylosporangium sp. NPDC049525]|uniref:sugar phosphate isomerase/epimerase family protein n=1 Tax=Dactylosporangium sp. NPDC049525 TaxID=3154730 RepID=UPI003444C3F6
MDDKETASEESLQKYLERLELHVFPILGPMAMASISIGDCKRWQKGLQAKGPYAAVTLAAPHIKHVQVSGTDRGAPGSDHLDWPRFLLALENAGYTGALCIESFTADNKTIATAASIWRSLAETQDQLALDGLDGLAHLRGLLASARQQG